MQALRVWDRSRTRVCTLSTPPGIWDLGYEIDHSWYNTRQDHDIDDDIEQDGNIEATADARGDRGADIYIFIVEDQEGMCIRKLGHIQLLLVLRWLDEHSMAKHNGFSMVVFQG